MYPQTPLSWTFGVEIEAFFAQVKKSDDFRRTQFQYLEDLHSVIAKRCLDCITTTNPKGIEDFSQWILTYDASLENEGTSEEKSARVISALGHKKARYHENQAWRADGVELISRPLPVPASETSNILDNDSFAEITTYLQAIKGNNKDSFGAFADKLCGLHVHIGLAPGSTDPGEQHTLNIFRQLALLLVQFEGVLSTLHSSERRGMPRTTSAKYASSNLVAFQEGQHTCTTGRYSVTSTHISVDEMTQRVNSCTTLEEIAYLMSASEALDDKHNPKDKKAWMGGDPSWKDHVAGNRYKMVNWTRLMRPHDEGRTIEFRQAAGTVDETEICRQVELCTALVQTAERIANNTQEAASGTADLNTLSTSLRLSPAAKTYWGARHTLHNPDPNTIITPPLRPYETCTACSQAHEQRSNRRARRTAAAKGTFGKKWRSWHGDSRKHRMAQKAQRTKTLAREKRERREAAEAIAAKQCVDWENSPVEEGGRCGIEWDSWSVRSEGSSEDEE